MHTKCPASPAAPRSGEPDDKLSQIRAITILVGTVSTLLVPVIALTTTASAEVWATAALALLSWLTLILIHTGHTQYIALGMVFSGLFIATLGVVVSGSVRSAMSFLFVGGVAAAGSFLGRKALIAAIGYSVAALAALNWAELAGLIHKTNPQVGLKVWATQSITVLIVGLMVYGSRNRANKAHRIQVSELLRRKETEQERDRAQARFARIFAASPSPMVAQSADSGLILDVNPAFERCFGYTKEQLIGQSDHGLWVEDDSRRAYTQRLLKVRRLNQQAARGVRADGSEFEALLSSEISGDLEDLLSITIVTDVSAEHASMERLRRSEERFAKAFNFSPLNLTIARLSDGAIVEHNRSARNQPGSADGAACGASALDAAFWSNPDSREPFIAKLLRDGSVRAHETRIQQPSGEGIDCRMWAELIEIDGEACALSCTANITEEKRREAQLMDLASGMAGHTGEAFFTALVDNMSKTMGADMLFVAQLDAQGEAHTLAGSMDGQPMAAFTYALAGSPCQETAGQPELCVYPDRVDEVFPQDLALSEGKFKAYVGQSLRDEAGQTVGILAALWRRPIGPFAEAAALMSIYGGRAAAELLRMQRDGEIQRLNETLEQRVRSRTAELQTLNAELDSFAYSVSHDLKTPLRSIDGFTQILSEQLQGRLSASEEGLFQRILGSTSRMGVLIADLLALARISQSELSWQWVDLSALAKDVLESLKATQFPDRVIDFRVAPHLTARCDPQLMRIALENLLGNAAKYTREQTPAVIEFSQSADEPGAAAVFCVRDNGVGFDMTNAYKLFKPFQRLHAPQSGFEGTGIGLATVRRIVERHGGTVRAQSDVACGAAFTFTLGYPPTTPPSTSP